MVKILMIDDEVEYIISHAEALKLLDYEVKTVSNVDEAYHLLGITSYDLLIIDLLMPSRPLDKADISDLRYTGVKLYTHIRNELKLQLPILIFSAVRDQELINLLMEKEKSILLDRLHFTKKPTRIPDFITHVKRILDGRKTSY